MDKRKYANLERLCSILLAVSLVVLGAYLAFGLFCVIEKGNVGGAIAVGILMLFFGPFFVYYYIIIPVSIVALIISIIARAIIKRKLAVLTVIENIENEERRIQEERETEERRVRKEQEAEYQRLREERKAQHEEKQRQNEERMKELRANLEKMQQERKE